MGWELEIAWFSTRFCPTNIYIFQKLKVVRILLDQSLPLNPLIFLQDDDDDDVGDDAEHSPLPFEYAIEKKHRFGEGFTSQITFRSLCFTE